MGAKVATQGWCRATRKLNNEVKVPQQLSGGQFRISKPLMQRAQGHLKV